MNFHFDEHFWVAFSVILFVSIIYKSLSNKIRLFLDKKIEDIRVEISESENIKKEAEQLIHQYQIKLKESDHTVLKMTKDAEDEISRISERFDIELNRIINEKSILTDKRIKEFENLMIYKVRMAAVDAGLYSACSALSVSDFRDKASSSLIKSIDC